MFFRVIALYILLGLVEIHVVLFTKNTHAVSDFNADGRVDVAAIGNRLGVQLQVEPILIGDVNQDCSVDLLDVQPFVTLLTSGEFQTEADTNEDGQLDLLDVAPFVDLLIGE